VDDASKLAANAFLKDWCAQVEQAKIAAFQKFANTVRAHWSGIIHFVDSNITNAILESIKSQIQLAKRRARGFRNVNNYTSMIYFLCAKLTFSYPRYFT
jgi:transposase